MNPQEAAHRLRLAEQEMQRAQHHHDRSAQAFERYRAAVSELAIAEAVAAVLVDAMR